MGTYAVVPVRISHNVPSNPAVIEVLHSVAGFRIQGCTATSSPTDAVFEYDVSASNHHMQQVPVIKHSDVLALLFCRSERCALTGFLMAHSFDKLLSCRWITMGRPGP